MLMNISLPPLGFFLEKQKVYTLKSHCHPFQKKKNVEVSKVSRKVCGAFQLSLLGYVVFL